MLAQIPTDIQQLIPAKYTAYVTAFVVLATTIGRAITALQNDTGFMAMFKSVFMGSSTTTQATPNNQPTKLDSTTTSSTQPNPQSKPTS